MVTEPKTEPPATEVKPEPKFTQQDLDRHIQERIARERQKYSDYDDLKKFREQHETLSQQQQQKELEAQKEYEKLKQQWQSQENQYKTILSQKDQEVQNMKIHNALYNEAMKNSAYPDAVDLIKTQAIVDKDGSIKIKGKDSNGMDVNLSVEEGVKQFLDQKPYLVKANGRSGAGTGSATLPGQNTGNRNLADELQSAMQSGDRKKAIEIKTLIRNKHSSLAKV